MQNDVINLKGVNHKEDYFPIIIINDETNNAVRALIYRFKINDNYNYLVIGSIQNIKGISEIKSFIDQIRLLIFNLFNNYEKYLELYETLKQSDLFSNFLFTQEGFDLISGKASQTNYEIARTIEIDTVQNATSLMFDNKYKVNEQNKVSLINNENAVESIDDFDTWEKYFEYYFLNIFDKNNVLYQQYVALNKDRIISYLQKHYKYWYDTHFDESEYQKNPIMYLTQCLDVILTLQFETEKYTKI